MNILIADDHAIVRKGLKDTLVEEFKILHFGEAENAQQTLALVYKQRWDLVLLDISMEGRSGLEVLEDIKKAKPRLPVLILSMYPEAEFAMRALRAGAAGYITKRSASDELVAAIRKVLHGGRYVSATLAEKLASVLHENTKPLHETLSNREFQVLLLIAQGRSVKEIAASLSLSEKTVGTYHTRVLQKTGLRSDVEVARYALQHKLVE